MKRRGFTLIELMMVVGIISVLITISVTAINSSLRSARTQRADALCKIASQGIAAYYAQKDEWPVEPKDNDTNKDYYTFKANEVREMIKKVVLETKSNNPLVDVSGLFVSRDTRDPVPERCPCKNPSYPHDRYRPAKGAYGLDFMQAIHGSKQSQKKMTLSEMSFGYPHPENGGFMRFVIKYVPASDSITVEQWHWGE